MIGSRLFRFRNVRESGSLRPPEGKPPQKKGKADKRDPFAFRSIKTSIVEFSSVSDRANDNSPPATTVSGTIGFLLVMVVGVIVLGDAFDHLDNVFSYVQILPGGLCLAFGLIGLIGFMKGSTKK